MTKLSTTVMPPLPDGEELKEFVLRKLKKYAAIPSLSGEESVFLRLLKVDFDEEYKGTWRTVYLDNKPHYYYREQLISPQYRDASPIRDHFLITHVDRVPDYLKKGKQPHITPIVVDTSECIHGQLDNIIGIVVARTLVHIGLPVKILFTTKEEVVQSTPQVLEVCKLSEKTPITIDIDVFDDLKQFEHGLVTLRKRDNAGDMLTPLVDKFQSIARFLDIPFTEKEGYAIVETGFLAKATKNKYQGAHVGIPIINYHSDEEATSWKVVYNTIKILHNFLITQHLQII